MANAKINRRSTGTKRPADVGGGGKKIFINTQTFLPRFTFMKNRKKRSGTEKGQNPKKNQKNNFHFSTCCALYVKRFSALLYIFSFSKAKDEDGKER